MLKESVNFKVRRIFSFWRPQKHTLIYRGTTKKHLASFIVRDTKDKKIHGRRRKRKRRHEKARQILEALGRKVSRKARAKRSLDSEIFCIFPSIFSSPFRSQFLPFSPPLSDPCGDFISFLCFQPSSSLLQQRHGDFPPSSTSGTLAMPVSRAQPSSLSLPFFSRFWRSFPCAYNAAPNLNPIFHITSRKSYSAAGQEAVRRTTRGTKERRNIFIFSLLLSSSLSLLSTPPHRSK